MLMYPFVVLGFYNYVKEAWNKKQQPEIAYLAGFYILFFSLVGHKEHRFMLPIMPFLYLILGFQLVKSV